MNKFWNWVRNEDDTITAVAADSNATIAITNGSTAVTNGQSATWSDGSNTLTVVVTSATLTDRKSVV